MQARIAFIIQHAGFDPKLAVRIAARAIGGHGDQFAIDLDRSAPVTVIDKRGKGHFGQAELAGLSCAQKHEARVNICQCTGRVLDRRGSGRRVELGFAVISRSSIRIAGGKRQRDERRESYLVHGCISSGRRSSVRGPFCSISSMRYFISAISRRWATMIA